MRDPGDACCSRVPAKDVERRRATARAWYQRAKAQLDRTKRDAARGARLETLTAWYVELKARLVCSHCGEDHPACLQFHHQVPTTKERSVSDAVRRGWSQARIERELAKCEVLCANCHAKHHAREGAP